MSTTPKEPMDELQEALEGLRKYVYDQFGIPTFVAESPSTATQQKYLQSLYPTVIEPPEKDNPWPLRNPVLDSCELLPKDKIIWVRFDEKEGEKSREKPVERKATDGENSGQV